jgi:hypothetical protein
LRGERKARGIAPKWPDRIYIEGKAERPLQWDEFKWFASEFESPLWRAIASRGEGRAHCGMDCIEDYRLIAFLRKGEQLDRDVCDAASWSVIVGPSYESGKRMSRPVEIPDFARGRWKTTPPLGILTA